MLLAQLRSILLFLVCLGIIGGGAWLANDMLNKAKGKQREVRKTQSLPSTVATRQPENDLEKVLDRNNAGELAQFISVLKDDPSKEIPARIVDFENRIRALNALLSVADSPISINFATENKLNAHIDLFLLRLEHDQIDLEMIVELQQLKSKLHVENFATNQNLAAAASVLGSIARFLIETDPQRREQFRQIALQEFDATASRSANDNKIAIRLNQFREIIGNRVPLIEADSFTSSFINQFADNTSIKVTDLVSNLTKSRGVIERSLTDLKELPAADRDEGIRQYTKELELMTRNASNDISFVVDTLRNAFALPKLGKSAAATRVLRLANELPEFDSPQVLILISALAREVAVLNSTFDPSGLSTVENQPARFQLRQTKFKVLLFGSGQSFGQSAGIFQKVTRVLGQQIRGIEIEFCLIYLDHGSIPQRQEIETLAKSDNPFQVWFLDTAQQSGRDFLSRFPIPKTPYLVIVGNENQVISANPTLEILQEFLAGNDLQSEITN